MACVMTPRLHNLKMYSPSKYLQQARKIYTLGKVDQKNHYDTLGVTAKATQADIKSAYYKLSMLYHPDKNKDSEDVNAKFRDITAAYEVLGNVKSRKLYDRGLFIQSPGTSMYDTPVNKFYQSRETKSKPPVAYGRTTVYDFDEWSRSHYGATFEKGLRFRQKQKTMRMHEQQTEQAVRSEKVVLLMGALMLFMGYLFFDKDYDNPHKPTV